jgi:hypothetical protein
MHQYLLAEQNREGIVAHNEELVVTTTKQVGKASFTSYDFNAQEEFHQLDAILSVPNADSLTVRDIALRIYGRDDDVLTRRVAGVLKYGSSYQKTLLNGRAVIARPNGTLRITASPDEYGDLVEENAALAVGKLNTSVKNRIGQIGRNFDTAVFKVPELEDRVHESRGRAGAALRTSFDRQLALLAGDD